MSAQSVATQCDHSWCPLCRLAEWVNPTSKVKLGMPRDAAVPRTIERAALASGDPDRYMAFWRASR